MQRRFDSELPDLDHDTELVLYRVAQEGLTNVVRHARARRCDVTVVQQGAVCIATVHDDGVGGNAEPGTGQAGDDLGPPQRRAHAAELGAERIYVLPTQEPHSRPMRVPTSALDAAIQGLHLLICCRVEADVARYSAEAELIVLPAPNAGCVQPTSFEHSQRLITDARAAARTALQRSTRRAHLRLVT